MKYLIVLFVALVTAASASSDEELIKETYKKEVVTNIDTGNIKVNREIRVSRDDLLAQKAALIDRLAEIDRVRDTERAIAQEKLDKVNAMLGAQ